MNYDGRSFEWGELLYRKLIEKAVTEIPQTAKIAVAGAGIASVWITKICSGAKLKIDFFIDEFPENSLVEGHVIRPQEIAAHNIDVIILSPLVNADKFAARIKNCEYNGKFIIPIEAKRVERFELSKERKDLNGLPGREWPLNVQIQTQSRCNALCLMCPYSVSWHKKNPGKMSMRLYNKIVSDLEHYRLGKLCLYLQNEPLLDPRWLDLARHAVKKLLFQLFEISTNIAALTDSRLEELIELLKGIPHEVWVSFQGHDKETYEKIMGLNFERSLKNLEKFIKAAQANGINYKVHGCGQSYKHEGRSTVLFPEDAYRDLFGKLAGKWGTGRIKVEYFRFHDRAGAIGVNNFNCHIIDLSRRYCHRVDTWLQVQYDGSVIFCCNDYSRKYVLGDMKKQSIMEYFHSDLYRKHRDMGLGIIESPDDFICKRCIKPGG